eukprot:TRINITY_DN1339_c0_g1_i2.p1 TRINITY_DN1339_c0_g1~~TRINITY_DN1339_c0_g1_i2.p1  ORF type:complete len:436 (-),score=70.51 TRINITY_DN1339_c0_g1_i2:60-1367(-)
MSISPLYLVVILLLGVLGSSEQVHKNRVLVLVDDLNIQNSHSIFFSQLKERGYHLSFFMADDPSLALTEYGEYLYDHLILFAPTVDEFGGIIDVHSILDFIDDGHNVLLAADFGVSDLIREIASECGVQFDDEGTKVIDHLNFDVSDYDYGHEVIVIDPSSDKDQIFSNSVIIPQASKLSPILYQGIGHSLEGSLNVPILTGSKSAYSAVSGKALADNPQVVGKKTVLASILQARNNARVAVAGSLALFSDRFFNSKVQKYGSNAAPRPSGNLEFVKQLSSWVFKEVGVIRASNLKHHIKGQSQAPAVYTVNQEIVFSVDIEQWNGKEWVPFVTNDVQLEFIMLDPYIRTFLKPDSKGHYSVEFKIPDVYGIFTFKVDYSQKGYTSLELIERVAVRPYRHNEYERFIPTAFPYYAGIFSMMIGLFFFSTFFLYSK